MRCPWIDDGDVVGVGLMSFFQGRTSGFFFLGNAEAWGIESQLEGDEKRKKEAAWGIFSSSSKKSQPQTQPPNTFKAPGLLTEWAASCVTSSQG